MDIQYLVGATLLSCRFSKGSYTFEFFGKFHNEHRTYIVTTKYCFSLSEDNLKDALEDISSQLWGFLERDVQAILVDETEGSEKVIFEFDGGDKFVIFSDGPTWDALIRIKIKETGEWIPIF